MKPITESINLMASSHPHQTWICFCFIDLEKIHNYLYYLMHAPALVLRAVSECRQFMNGTVGLSETLPSCHQWYQFICPCSKFKELLLVGA